MDTLKVCISGDLGGGKSELARGLSEHYGCNILSMGAIQRQMAKQYGMDTLEFNKYSEANPEIDLERDRALVVHAKSVDKLIIDSRMAWHFLPDSIKIHLLVHPSIAARRILKAGRSEESYRDEADAARALRERKESENRRFLAIYGVDCDKFANYNFVIDTTCAATPPTTDLVVALIESAAQKKHARVWVASKNLFPTQKISASMKIDHQDAAHLFNSPILAIRHHGAFYIYDGHKRVCAAISQGIEFTPVVLVESENQMFEAGSPTEFVNRSFSREVAQEWENALGFSFQYFPG